MTIAELTPDVALAALLDNEVIVYSGYESRNIRCYAQAKMPNKGLDDEFLTVQNNGVITSWTRPIGQFKGNLALTLYCKANADGTAKTARLRQMVAQCAELVNCKTSDGFPLSGERQAGYFFELDPTNVITPPTVNLTTGYATTVINVAWHTT